MISIRVLTVLFLFVAFGLFAYAAPTAGLVARTNTCSTYGINFVVPSCVVCDRLLISIASPGCSEGDIISILLDLKAKILVHLALLGQLRHHVPNCLATDYELR